MVKRKTRKYRRNAANTRGRRKYQCTAPAAWAPIFRLVARESLGRRGTEAHGIAIALGMAVQLLAEVHGIARPGADENPDDPDQIPLPFLDEIAAWPEVES